MLPQGKPRKHPADHHIALDRAHRRPRGSARHDCRRTYQHHAIGCLPNRTVCILGCRLRKHCATPRAIAPGTSYPKDGNHHAASTPHAWKNQDRRRRAPWIRHHQMNAPPWHAPLARSPALPAAPPLRDLQVSGSPQMKFARSRCEPSGIGYDDNARQYALREQRAKRGIEKTHIRFNR
ncbi:Uncharacterised protein [Bifidobacterium bifidum]|nr:Uncharacterised protein [Bifidobacterium bifidum]